MRWAYLAVLALFPVSELVLLFVKRARGEKTKVDDARTGRNIWRAIGFGVVAAIGATRLHTLYVPIPYMTLFTSVIVLMLLGMVIRFTAIITLGRYFTVNVATLKEHRLVES